MGVDIEQRGRVTIVTINRPEVRNAVDYPTSAALAEAFAAFDSDSSCGTSPAIPTTTQREAGGGSESEYLPFLKSLQFTSRESSTKGSFDKCSGGETHSSTMISSTLFVEGESARARLAGRDRSRPPDGSSIESDISKK